MHHGLTGILLGLLAGTAHAAVPSAFEHQVYQAMVEHNFHGDWHSDCSRLPHGGALRQWWRLGQGQLDIVETRYSDDDCPVATVCHAPGVLRHTRGVDGAPLFQGRQVTGFSNSEEAAVQLTEVVPFLVEEMLQANGGHYQKGPDWQPFVLRDGLLITGQNPASSEQTAETLLAALAQ